MQGELRLQLKNKYEIEKQIENNDLDIQKPTQAHTELQHSFSSLGFLNIFPLERVVPSYHNKYLEGQENASSGNSNI